MEFGEDLLISIQAFQSLKGIMCDWERKTRGNRTTRAVSIPERDYVWLRELQHPYWLPLPVSETFQSLKGIMCDWELPLCLIQLIGECFNPWKGLCVIESRLMICSLSPCLFQSLKGIMCDWELGQPEKCGWLKSFNPWKGLCVIESVGLFNQAAACAVSIPERDYVWLRGEVWRCDPEK